MKRQVRGKRGKKKRHCKQKSGSIFAYEGRKNLLRSAAKWERDNRRGETPQPAERSASNSRKGTVRFLREATEFDEGKRRYKGTRSKMALENYYAA